MGIENTPRLVVDTNIFRGLDATRIGALADRGFKLSASETAISEARGRSAAEREAGKSVPQARGHLFTIARKWAPYVDPEYPVWSLNTISDSRGVSFIEVEESAKPFAATDGTGLVGSTGR